MIKPEIFLFLDDMAQNFSQEWLREHQERHEECMHLFEQGVGQLLNTLSEFDHHLSGLTAKDCVFPLDLSTSLEPKGPTTPQLGAYMAYGGHDAHFAGFYLELGVERCIFGAGMYQPNKPLLRRIRHAIASHSADFSAIIDNPDFIKAFPELLDHRVKGAPFSIPKDHQLLDWLRLTSVFVVHRFSREEVLSQGFLQQYTELAKLAHPLNQFLNQSLIN